MLLHHWDTDGIASAAMYIRIHGDKTLFTPKIGNFYLDDSDFSTAISEPQLTILDMNIPDAKKLCKYVDLRIYDHHRATKVECAKEHYNPYLDGKQYPSCTLVLAERFAYPIDYLVALGVVGDMGPELKNIKEWNLVQKVLRAMNISFSEIQRAVELLDSSFKLNKRDEVTENVHLVLNSVQEVLSSEHLQRNVDTLKTEIQKWTEAAEDRGRYYYLTMRSQHQIISSVTRNLAWNFGKPAIVINEKEDRDELYIRSPAGEPVNILPIIELAKSRGYRAGGKDRVMGAILPRGEGKKFAMDILEVLKW